MIRSTMVKAAEMTAAEHGPLNRVYNWDGYQGFPLGDGLSKHVDSIRLTHLDN